MGKLPWAKFYYSDFLQDTETLSNKATGGWVRILCKMWHRLEGEITGNDVFFLRLLRCDKGEMMEIFDELEKQNICDVSRKDNGEITVMSRRLKRENKSRKDNALRQQRHRMSRKNNGTEVRSQKSEVRSQKSEVRKKEENIYTPNSEIQEIFDFWNSKKIITHRNIHGCQNEIAARLKEYSVEEIKEAINNYAIILFGDQYIWSYRWTLKDFLGRQKDNISRFLNQSHPFKNFQKRKTRAEIAEEKRERERKLLKKAMEEDD